MSVDLSRNAKLVKYFAQQYRGIPRTVLVKLIYMADVISREYAGRPLSSFDYHFDKYGPYDSAIEDAVAELVDAGLATTESDWWSPSSRFKRLNDSHLPVAFDFDLVESAVLGYVVDNYKDMPRKELLEDVVYQTPPMKAGVPRGKRLPMSMLDNAGTQLVGFSIDEVLEAEKAGREGDWTTLSAFVDELRAKAPA